MCSILSPLPLSLYFLLIYPSLLLFFFFFFNDTATTEIYTLSLHDALPIWPDARRRRHALGARVQLPLRGPGGANHPRSEEHTSELQSRPHLVCRLLLEKKKKKKKVLFLCLLVVIVTMRLTTVDVYDL